MRRLVASLALLVALPLGIAIGLAVALAPSVTPRPSGADTGGMVPVRAWVPAQVTQADGTRVWILSDRAGLLEPPFVLVPATPVPYVPGGGQPYHP